MNLSAAQRKMLKSARDHGNAILHLHGRSATGGAHRTYRALRRMELMDRDWHITSAGSAILDEIEDQEAGHDPRTPAHGVGYEPG